MSIKRVRKQKIKYMQQLAENIDYSIPQRTLTSTAYEPQTDYKDPTCMYARGCTMNCINCRRLK